MIQKHNKMKHTIVLISLILGSFNLFSQTAVTGSQSGTWTLDGSPYEVNGHITVPTGQTLSIEAGVEVNFQGYYKFNVDGKIIVNGTADQMVVFTTDNIGTGWGGIRLDQTSQISEFHYCKIEHGKTASSGAYPDIHGGAVLLKESNAEFYNCIFANNDATGSGDDGMGGAIYAINTGSEEMTLTKFIDCEFINNHAATEGGAIKFTNDGNTELTNCVFKNNNCNYGGGAIMFYSAVDVHMTKCLFFGNYSNNSGGGAIKTLNPTVTLYFTNCTFYDNSAYGAGEGGAVALDYADAMFTNSIIYDNYQQYGDDVTIGMSASAIFNFCDVNMPDYGEGANNIYTDPNFVDPSSYDFHLQSSSPCIDAGTDVGLPYTGANPDMGCYEFGASSSLSESLENSIEIYPNPVNNSLHISTDAIVVSVEISNLIGKTVIRKSTHNNTLDLSQLNNGTYLIHVQLDNGTNSVSKLVVAH